MPSCTSPFRQVTLALIAAVLFAFPLAAFADSALVPGCAMPAQTFSGSGSTAATNSMSAFSASIGGVNNGGASPQSGGFRTVNWDAVLLNGTDFGGNTTPIVANKITGIPTTRFQSRGVLFDRVHAVANDGFASANAGQAGQFPAFSPANTFSPYNTNKVTVSFVLAGTATPALTRGFGAIFLDVETANTTSIEYFNGAQSLGKYFVPTGTSGQPEFLGVLYAAPIVTSVVITPGTAQVFNFNGVTVSSGPAESLPGTDLVALDDFVYAEPTTTPPNGVTLTGVEGTVVGGAIATFTDTDPAGIASQFTASINWGDGVTSSATVSGGAGCFNVSGTHTYEEGTFPIVITVNDIGGSTLTMNASAVIADAGLLPACAGSPTTFSGTGGTIASGGATTAMASFTAGIGGVNNGGTPSPQAGGFRSINWDAVLLDGTDFGGNNTVIVANKVTGIATTRFQSRGVLFDRVLAVANDGFVSTNAAVAGQFPAFSPSNTFAPYNTNALTVNFVLAGSSTPALTRGFGAIFLDVETANTTNIEFFNGTTSLGKFFAPATTSGLPSFLGVLFNAPIVSRVVITPGTAQIFSFNGTTLTPGSAESLPNTDLVALDDFVYSEPTPATSIAFSGVEGATVGGVVATFGDANVSATASNFTATINWGDGVTSSGVVSGSAGCFNVSGTHAYKAGSFPITITINDTGGSTVTKSASATISDAPLTATGMTFAAPGGALFSGVVASFTDADPFAVAGNYGVTINWGDSTTSAGTVTSSGSGFNVSGTHTYTTGPATRTVIVTINDVGGATATATSTANVSGLHGDANGDGQVTAADIFYMINYLFAGGAAPIGIADVNGDSQVTAADIFYLINYLFAGGAAPH